ncbi:hypothetical protein AAG589_21020 [Isoptericola sp. F-RaC21]|uniref:hypothetical protein n=1 Tax=Isoptericola sp. F-RaC21 TaxID=3141452 RepID=UPI00315BA126
MVGDEFKLPPDVPEYLATWGAYAKRTTWDGILAKDPENAVARQALDELPDVGPLDALAANAAAVNLLVGRRWYVIRAAREAGETWEAIGTALGISKQGAQDYYRRKIEQQERYAGDLHDAERARAALGGSGGSTACPVCGAAGARRCSTPSGQDHKERRKALSRQIVTHSVDDFGTAEQHQ